MAPRIATVSLPPAVSGPLFGELEMEVSAASWSGGPENDASSGGRLTLVWWGQEDAETGTVMECPSRCLFPLRTNRQMMLAYFADIGQLTLEVRSAAAVENDGGGCSGQVSVPLRFALDEGAGGGASLDGTFTIWRGGNEDIGDGGANSAAARPGKRVVGEVAMSMRLRFGAASLLCATLERSAAGTTKPPGSGYDNKPARRLGPVLSSFELHEALVGADASNTLPLFPSQLLRPRGHRARVQRLADGPIAGTSSTSTAGGLAARPSHGSAARAAMHPLLSTAHGAVAAGGGGGGHHHPGSSGESKAPGHPARYEPPEARGLAPPGGVAPPPAPAPAASTSDRRQRAGTPPPAVAAAAAACVAAAAPSHTQQQRSGPGWQHSKASAAAAVAAVACQQAAAEAAAAEVEAHDAADSLSRLDPRLVPPAAAQVRASAAAAPVPPAPAAVPEATRALAALLARGQRLRDAMASPPAPRPVGRAFDAGTDAGTDAKTDAGTDAGTEAVVAAAAAAISAPRSDGERGSGAEAAAEVEAVLAGLRRRAGGLAAALAAPPPGASRAAGCLGDFGIDRSLGADLRPGLGPGFGPGLGWETAVLEACAESDPEGLDGPTLDALLAGAGPSPTCVAFPALAALDQARADAVGRVRFGRLRLTRLALWDPRDSSAAPGAAWSKEGSAAPGTTPEQLSAKGLRVSVFYLSLSLFL